MPNADWSGASFDGDAVTLTLQYDSTNFKLTQVIYQNLSSQNAVVTAIDPSQGVHTFTLTANTSQTSVNITSLGLTMSTTVGIDPKTGQQETFVNLPTGWQMYTSWPA